MTVKKIEKLLDSIINREEDLAHSLFHEIIVEKSKKIYNESKIDPELEKLITSLKSSSNDPSIDAEIEKILDQHRNRENQSNPLSPFRDVVPGHIPSDNITDPQERDRMMEPVRRPSYALFQQMTDEFHDLRRAGLDTEEALDRIRGDLEQDDFGWTDDEIASILADLNINDINTDDDEYDDEYDDES